MCDSSLDVTVNKNSFISQTNIRIMSMYTIDGFGCPGQKSKELRLPMPSSDSVRADSVAVGKLGGNIRRKVSCLRGARFMSRGPNVALGRILFCGPQGDNY